MLPETPVSIAYLRKGNDEMELELEDVKNDMFSDIDGDESQLLAADGILNDGFKENSNEIIENVSKSRSSGPQSHIFQEMMVVRNRLGFDEQDFRDRVQLSSSEISQEFKDIVTQLYDVVDAMVNDISKKMHQRQMEQYQELDTKLAGIRRHSVEAETLDQSLKLFINSVGQAYQQSFGNVDK